MPGRRPARRPLQPARAVVVEDAVRTQGRGGQGPPAHGFPLPSEVKTILDSINDGVFTVDGEFVVTTFNRAAATITGVGAREAIGRPCREVLRSSLCKDDCALKQTIATSRPVTDKRAHILSAAGSRVPISVSTALLRDGKGRVIGGVEAFRDLSLVEFLRREVEGRHAFGDILSADPKMREVFDLLPLVAEGESPVLIRGESGTGKELLARTIHDLSPRAGGALLAIHCAALPDSLLEPELFGRVEDAVTGASRSRRGRLEAARGGTVFLDDVGDLSPALQVRLLKVLQESAVERVGSGPAVGADVRFIAATRKDLGEEVRAGRFREDLFRRLSAVQIAVPPLRERLGDVPLLARHFVERLNRLHGRDIQGIAPEAMALLVRHSWPGNVGELENAVEHAFVLCRSGIILPENLPASLSPAPPPRAEAPPAAKDLRQAEMAMIYSALERNRGNRSAAARELGIHKTTLWRKLKREVRAGVRSL